jgi:hypothetical protein
MTGKSEACSKDALPYPCSTGYVMMESGRRSAISYTAAIRFSKKLKEDTQNTGKDDIERGTIHVHQTHMDCW